ncbi:MAG: right-handed parallel beta-helix repeat-containing protein, partial [Alphaproteobacteria bacterium]|nr:right-handed parallel beta-helix repeat-containing protein [Alphaproteobacteria bacterium]
MGRRFESPGVGDAAALALALVAALGAAPAGASAKAPSPAAVVASAWGPWIEAGGVWSSERSRAESTLWLPLWQSRTSLLFADLRGKLFEESVAEGNFALGFRHMLPNGWNLGAWAGYDVRRTTTGSLFRQAAFGLEALHPVWDVRLNGYVPLSAPAPGGSLAEVQLSGPQIVMTGGFEVPLYGLDAEIGVRLPWTSDKHELRLYGGGFWFDHEDALREVAGPKARLEWRVADA